MRGVSDAILSTLPVLAWPALGLFVGSRISLRLKLPPAFWLPLVLAAGSLLAYGLMWAWWFAPELAPVIGFAAILLSALGFAADLLESSALRRMLRHRDCWLPCTLTVSAAALCLAYLCWPGGGTAQDRFTIPMPVEDHLIPQRFADRLALGQYRDVTPPPISTLAFETRSSDRPPLQSAIVLAVRAIDGSRRRSPVHPWTYQVVGTSCQVACIPALFALSRALRLSRRSTRFVLAGTFCSGFFLVQAIYPWPKLLAAGHCITALAMFVHAVRCRTPLDSGGGAALGALTALSLLAHGGPFFSLVAAPVLLSNRQARTTLRPLTLAAMFAAFAVVVTPWLAYQKYYDPPGNRLVKLHLAGVELVDPRGTLQTIYDAYSSVGVRDWISGRAENLREQWIVLGKSGRDSIVPWIQWQQFFHHVAALDTLAIGLLLALVRRERPPIDGVSLRDIAVLSLTAWAVWLIVLFPSGSAMIHHGSYATTLLLFVCGSAGLARIGLPGEMLLWAHVCLFALGWLTPLSGRGSSPPSTWSLPAVTAFVLGASLFASCLYLLREPDDVECAA